MNRAGLFFVTESGATIKGLPVDLYEKGDQSASDLSGTIQCIPALPWIFEFKKYKFQSE